MIWLSFCYHIIKRFQSAENLTTEMRDVGGSYHIGEDFVNAILVEYSIVSLSEFFQPFLRVYCVIQRGPSLFRNLQKLVKIDRLESRLVGIDHTFIKKHLFESCIVW